MHKIKCLILSSTSFPDFSIITEMSVLSPQSFAISKTAARMFSFDSFSKSNCGG